MRPGGILYYHRRIPTALQKHYDGQRFRKVSLGTRNLQEATKKAAALAKQDDALWMDLRCNPDMTTQQTKEGAQALLKKLDLAPGAALREYPAYEDTPIEVVNDYLEARYGAAFMDARYEEDDAAVNELITPAEREAVRLIKEDPNRPLVRLSDALESYLANHDKGSDEKFIKDAKLAVGHVFSVVGDLPLGGYRRQHAKSVRDHLLAKGNKSGTVRRRNNTIKAVFNHARLEFDLQGVANPFETLKIPNEKKDAKKRIGFTHLELETIAAACVKADDDIRHIAAMNLDLGARLWRDNLDEKPYCLT
jgi:hypothetical protein